MDKELLEKTYENSINNITEHIETGYYDLDEILQCCKKGSLITVGGVNSIGKSAFCRNILLNQLTNGKKCMYFDLDWSKEQFIQSLMFLNAEISLSKRNSLSDTDKDKLKTAKEKMSDWKLEVFDCTTYKLEQIIQAIESYKPEYVFIDPLHEVRIADNSNNTKDILEKMQDCARKTNTTIFITSTLENTVETNEFKRPTWKDFNNSEAVIKYSDQILLLYRPSYYYAENELPEGHENGKIEVIACKYMKCYLTYEFDNRICKIKPNTQSYEF